jgi:CheY-like chemotaxis protein
MVEVHDTGPGIPKDQQSLIFKEFQRLTTNPPGSTGLGLGLSIVERIGRVLEHAVDLTSIPGRGSVFSVTVPLARPSELAARRAPRRHPKVGQISGCQVLCIDNEPAILDGMEVLLRNWGCHVIKALSIDEAAARARRYPGRLDVVLADFHLDEGTGMDAVQAVRDAVGETVPAVIITADRSPEVKERVRAEGLQMLRKPIRPAALRALMAQANIRSAAAE